MGGPRPICYAVANHEVTPRFQPVEDRALSVAEQSYRSLIKSNIIQSLDRISTFARDNGMEFRLAFMDAVIPSNPKLQFDPDFMRSAFEFGASKGRNQAWRTEVPIGTVLLGASSQ